MQVTDYELFEVPPRWQFLRLETDTGLVGWGEPIVEGRPDTTRAATAQLVEDYVLGADPTRIEDLWTTMYRRKFYRRGAVLYSAISGIDQALWDLTGKHRGLPVYDLLGGPVRDRVRIYQHVGGATPEEAATSAAEAVEAGFTALKTTPTGPVRRIDAPETVHAAAEYVGAIREAVGPGVDIGLDLHGRVSKSMAKRLVAAIDPHEPMFYEEPVLPEQSDAIPEVAAKTTTPIATGERLYTRWEFKPVLERGGIDLIQPDVSHTGGITELRKIAAMAEAYDVGLAPHAPLGPVNFAASLHVDAVAHNAVVQEQILDRAGTPTYLAEESLIDHEDGYVELPTAPGLGVEIDEEALRAADGETDWSPPDWRHDDGSLSEW